MGNGLMLDADASSVSEARRYCAACLVEWGVSGLVDTVTLLVSELVTNVVLHAGTACELRLERGANLRVEVVDGSERTPSRGLLHPEGSSGRGLLLVEALSTACGTIVEADRKRVWFEVAWPPAKPT